MYEGLALVYDKLNYDIDYERWAGEYDRILKRHHAARIAEVACGTGQITLRLARLGYQILGLDLSPEMLRQAGENARSARQQIRFVQQDMRELQLPRPVDAILCPCASVNHLIHDEDIVRFFAACHANLREQGILVFDISTPQKMRDTLEKEVFFDVGEDVALLWKTSGKGRLLRLDLTMFLDEKQDGSYIRLDEEQHQRIFERSEMSALVEKTFELVEVTSVSFAPGDDRHQFVCRKGKK